MTGGSTIGMMIPQLTALPQIVTTALGAAVPAALLIQETVQKWREKQAEA